MTNLPPEAMLDVAAYFQALSEPTRLQLLNLLREGERNVGDLAQRTGFTAANISRHMSMLSQHGMVARESRGTSVYYRISDDSIYALCDLVCGNSAREHEAGDQRLDEEEQARSPEDGQAEGEHGGFVFGTPPKG